VQLKKIITTVRIRLEGWDKYQIVAYIVGFHMICNMTIFWKILNLKVIQNIFENLIFQKPTFLKFLKNHQNLIILGP
jgi:hypothetical protein